MRTTTRQQQALVRVPRNQITLTGITVAVAVCANRVLEGTKNCNPLCPICKTAAARQIRSYKVSRNPVQPGIGTGD